MIRGRAPHAVLLVGPSGVGKTTLALDLAAGLLCTADDPAARPCGICRACRRVMTGSHPDLHRLGPEGPGRQVVIGGPGSKARGVRGLIGELALLPVEGGARVAIVEAAGRMHDDAQSALLKTLEEPPAGVTLVLCADAEEPLLPTIRSRCARLRLGPVDVRSIEAILAAHGIADPALAARLARIADGRPGLALAWARDPDALRRRDELTRTLLDLTRERPAERLARLRAGLGDAASIGDVADRTSPDVGPITATAASSTATPARESATAGSVDVDDDGEAAATGRAPAAARRRAAEALVGIWVDVTRDLLLVHHRAGSALRDPRLLEEYEAVADLIPAADLAAFLDRLGRALVLLIGNVSPELVLDDLALAWPAVPDATSTAA